MLSTPFPSAGRSLARALHPSMRPGTSLACLWHRCQPARVIPLFKPDIYMTAAPAKCRTLVTAWAARRPPVSLQFADSRLQQECCECICLQGLAVLTHTNALPWLGSTCSKGLLLFQEDWVHHTSLSRWIQTSRLVQIFGSQFSNTFWLPVTI